MISPGKRAMIGTIFLRQCTRAVKKNTEAIILRSTRSSWAAEHRRTRIHLKYGRLSRHGGRGSLANQRIVKQDILMPFPLTHKHILSYTSPPKWSFILGIRPLIVAFATECKAPGFRKMINPRTFCSDQDERTWKSDKRTGNGNLAAIRKKDQSTRLQGLGGVDCFPSPVFALFLGEIPRCRSGARAGRFSPPARMWFWPSVGEYLHKGQEVAHPCYFRPVLCLQKSPLLL